MSEVNENTNATEETAEDLNEQITEEIDDAEVMQVPIDDTLSISGEAADAKAVGDALAGKADKSEVQTKVSVNGQQADNQGLIILLAGHIPISEDTGAQTVMQVLTSLGNRTGADIKIDSSQGAKTIQEALNTAVGQTADAIKMNSQPDALTVAQAMASLQQAITGNGNAITLLQTKTGSTIKLNDMSNETIAQAIASIRTGNVFSVNGVGPDQDGNVTLIVVPYAENLATEDTKEYTGTFIRRTSAGTGSISDGKAWLNNMHGAGVHTGYVAESLEMTVIPVTREEGETPITATIDRDTFVAYVSQSGTYDLYYTTQWSASPALYGITVTGTPVAGDQIHVVYVKEVRGTITMAKPTAIVGTGWNLYNHTTGMAQVVKYSSVFGYKIGGTYTSIAFSTDPEDEDPETITPDENGLFNIPEDGYVFVEGGDDSSTYILTTWSDWTGGPAGDFEAYKESTASIATIMSTYFPNGLMGLATVYDEIDRNSQKAISRIERKAYSAENRAAAEASGREYDFDENYVYIERETPAEYDIELDGVYDVSEHGLEYIPGTAVAVYCDIQYGENLKDKLRREIPEAIEDIQEQLDGLPDELEALKEEVEEELALIKDVTWAEMEAWDDRPAESSSSGSSEGGSGSGSSEGGSGSTEESGSAEGSGGTKGGTEGSGGTEGAGTTEGEGE